MRKLQTFFLGVIVGSLCVGSASYAAERIQIDVAFPDLAYWLDGTKITSQQDHDGKFASGGEDLPLTILYKDTNYVPLRFIAQALGKELLWDKENNRMLIQSVADVPFAAVLIDNAPEEIRQWVERSRDKHLGQSRTYAGNTYILVTRGEKASGGYEATIASIRQYADKSVVTVELRNPPKGSVATQPLTFPTALVKVEGELKGEVSFVDQTGAEFTQPVGFSYVPPLLDQTANIALFHPVLDEGFVELQGMVRAFEGMLNYRIEQSDGTVLERNVLQAKAGAPNWGHFSLALPLESAQRGMSVHFYLVSPKDGAEQEEAVYTF